MSVSWPRGLLQNHDSKTTTLLTAGGEGGVTCGTKPSVSLSAVILCDGGQDGDRVTLPASKILELGLTPVLRASGGVEITKNSDGTRIAKVIFSPPVTVRLHFTRPDSVDIEDRAVQAIVACREDDWNAAIAAAALQAASGPTSTCAAALGPHLVAAIPLSPMSHVEQYVETCGVGEYLLGKLGARINQRGHILEIGEEDIIEEEG